MREADLEALRSGYEAWNRGDLNAVLALVDDGIEWSPGEDAPESGEFTGRETFREFVQSWTESFDDLRVEPQELVAVGDRVVAMVRQRGRGRGSRVELDINTVHVWTIREGRAVGWKGYRNRDEALKAVRNAVDDRVALISHLYELLNQGDVETALGFVDPDIEWQTYIVPGPGGGLYRGHDGVRALWGEAQRVFGDFRNVPEAIFAAGEHVIAHVCIEGVGAKSGVAVQARIAHLFTFRDGKVVSVRSFGDREQAHEAAGAE